MSDTRHRYPELDRMLGDMRAQSELYKPTSFWTDASKHTAQEIAQAGIDRFRSLPTPLRFFVPTYGVPGNRFAPELVAALDNVLAENYPDQPMARSALRQFLSGETAALADFRVLLAADDPVRLPHLHTFSESGIGAPVEQFEFEQRRFSRSALNYLLGLVLLKRHLREADLPRVVLEIGGGFGTLGEVLASSGIDGLRYIDLDIPPTSFVAQYYLSRVLGGDRVASYAQTRDSALIEVDSLPTASVLCSWQIERLRGRVDLFVNFISFQEMEPSVVSNYLSHVARLETRWVLLRNLREGQRRRDERGDHAGVDAPIRGDEYLAMLPDYELIDRQVHPFGYRTVDGFHSELLLLHRKA